MRHVNGFELLIAVVFNMIPQLGVLGPKSQELLIPSCLGEGESLTYFHLRALAIKIELILMRDEICHINNLTVKYIMEILKLKDLQRYMTSFELNFGKFERQPQRDQLSIIFRPSIEIIFETLETADIDMHPYQ